MTHSIAVSPFEARIEAIDRIAVDKRTGDEKVQKHSSLLDQLYPKSKNWLKKIIMRRHPKEMQENTNDFVHSAGVGRPILEIDRVKSPKVVVSEEVRIKATVAIVLRGT